MRQEKRHDVADRPETRAVPRLTSIDSGLYSPSIARNRPLRGMARGSTRERIPARRVAPVGTVPTRAAPRRRRPRPQQSGKTSRSSLRNSVERTPPGLYSLPRSNSQNPFEIGPLRAQRVESCAPPRCGHTSVSSLAEELDQPAPGLRGTQPADLAGSNREHRGSPRNGRHSSPSVDIA